MSSVRFYWRATGPNGRMSPEYETRAEAKAWLQDACSGAPVTFKYSVKLYRAETKPAKFGPGFVTSVSCVGASNEGNV